MSAAPRPQIEEVAHGDAGPEPDADGWALLQGMRRRLDEQANQHRRTQSQVTQLAESIAALVGEQRRRSRWLNVNSFAAYLIFTMLCGGAFYLLYENRARDLVSDRDRVASERDKSAEYSKKVSDQLAAREAADAKAWDAYQLLETGKREDAAKKLAELSAAPLSRLDRHMLDARAKQAEVMQVDAALKGAVSAFKAGRHPDAIVPLETALTLESVGPRASLLHYYLGVAYAKAGGLDKSIAHLQEAVDGDVDVEDARFHLASVLDRAGQWGKARVEYERFATAHPMSSFTAFATRRSGTLSRAPAVAPVVPAPAKRPATPAPTKNATPATSAAPARAAAPKAPVVEPTPPPKTLDFNEPE
jgi:tetratricopeptide (TPR) repeat protein